jgi:hypothetical protein
VTLRNTPAMVPTQSSCEVPDFFGRGLKPNFFNIALKSEHDIGG